MCGEMRKRFTDYGMGEQHSDEIYSLKRQKARHPDGPSAREKVYEEMQDNLLSLKSSLAFDNMISSYVKKVCRNMNITKVYFFNSICVQSVKTTRKAVEKICALC